MNKEKALEEFLNSFRITLNHASVYFKEHPMFVQSMKDLNAKASTVFSFVNSFKIGVTPHSLLIEGKSFERTRGDKELAEIFHYRKIKSIELHSPMSVQELTAFVFAVSLPSREVFARGGINCIIKRAALTHINVEELDYSQLLMGEGQEYKDIWVFLLGAVTSEEKSEEVEQFVENFPKILSKFRNCDFIENDLLRENMIKFLEYLKDKDQLKFHKCAKELTKAILRDKNIPEEQKFDKLKVLLAAMDAEDLAQTLWDEILTDDDFDIVSFTVFSRLIDKEKHGIICSSLAEKIKNERAETFNPKMHKKIRELFLQASTPFILETYRRTFSPLLQSIPSADAEFLFDREVLKKNYRVMLLNLFIGEKNNVDMSLMTKRIIDELEVVAQEKDFGYLEALLEMTAKAKKENSFASEFSETIEQHAYHLLEDGLLEEEEEPDLAFFIKVLKKSHYGIDFYFDKIFSQKKTSVVLLKLFFKFFPEGLPSFYKRLEDKANDSDFLKKMLECLGSIDSRRSAEVLEHLFWVCGNFLKIEILKSMQRISFFDDDFLLPIVRKGDVFLKREALLILQRKPETKKRAVAILINVANPFGINNNVLRQNLKIIEEMDLRDAVHYLPKLIRRSFFNRTIRKQAQALFSAWTES
jgi:hypothetical protein